MINWVKNASGTWEPTSGYPSKLRDEDYNLPKGIQDVHQHLNSLIETKYAREYIKMCAFYNKLFPNLKSWDWSRATHNSPPFSIQEQERHDSGTGIVENFLKKAIDGVVARIANVRFEATIEADVPNLLLEIFKAPVERYLKQIIKNNKLTRAVTECFHDAAILGFGHLFIDPWTGAIRKVSDWELGIYESEFASGNLKRALIRDFAFPVTGLQPYIHTLPEEKIRDIIRHKPQVDLKLFLDAVRHEAYVTIDTTTLDPIPYPFDSVLLTTYSWDLGIKRTMVTSAFDMGYPVQRAISKLNAKKTQLIDQYKGPIPVFSNDCEVVVKQMGNNAGEALFLASGRTPADVITVINATPLDPEMNAEKETLKTTLQELMGMQNMNLDMENIRSAATIVALEQLHDQEFQSQLTGIGAFVADALENSIKFVSSKPDSYATIERVPWTYVSRLMNYCYIDLKVIHNPTEQPITTVPDYAQVVIDQAVADIITGNKHYGDIAQDYVLNPVQLRSALAGMLVKLRAVGDEKEMIDNLEACLLDAFIDDVRTGAAVI
jgi:hypothetical protein